jgi:hypothetical protein
MPVLYPVAGDLGSQDIHALTEDFRPITADALSAIGECRRVPIVTPRYGGESSSVRFAFLSHNKLINNCFVVIRADGCKALSKGHEHSNKFHFGCPTVASTARAEGVAVDRPRLNPLCS